MPNLAPVCFVDCETTGLDPNRHEIWEVGLILPGGIEHGWFLPVDEERADLIALNIGGYFDRHPYKLEDDFDFAVTAPRPFAGEFQRLTRGLHLAGAVPSFDADFLSRLMLLHHVRPAWHYHLIDVEPLAVGYVVRAATAIYDRGGGSSAAAEHAENMRAAALTLPWNSDQLSAALGIEPANYERHTALGDARWAKAIYDKVMA